MTPRATIFPISGAQRSPRNFCLTAACALLLMLSTAGAHASTLDVPSSFPTIGAAYTAASNGDTIRVADGNYSAAGLAINKTLTIQSVNGAALTSIDCTSNYFALVNSNATIQGFTFKNSNSSDTSPIFVQVSCTISQCVFSQNTNFGGNGGAIELNGGTTSITGCTFDQNNGSGAISSSGGSATIDSCTFTNNNAQNGGGGGVINLNTGNFTITKSTFSNNTGGTQAGGVFYWRNATLNVSDSSFNSNSASYGGVILEGAQGINSPATFTRCKFTGNTASVKGGVAALEGGSSGTTSFIAVDCLFIGNSSAGDGGAVDGITAGASANAVNLKNCSFFGNGATGANTGVICGGATTTTTITNCILYGDTAPNEISTANPSNSTVVTFTDIKQAAFAGGTGDINSDPLYVNGSGGDLHLSTGSPCIDTGTATGAPLTDYISYAFGNTRSMGAYSPIIFVVTSATPIVSGNTTSTTVTATSADGSTTITNYTGTVHFTSTDAAATLPSNTTLVNGTGTFTPTLNTAGSQTITVTDTVNAPFTGTSNAIAVTGPTITSVVPPANKTYIQGENIDFTVTFSKPVNVLVSGGTPSFPVTVGTTARTANYLSGSGTSSVIFRITVLSGDMDTDGITTSSPISLNGGTIKDFAANDAVLTFTPPNTTGILVDGTQPVITGVVANPSSAVLKTGDSMTFVTTFSEAIAITTTGGTPSITVTVGSTNRSATLVSSTSTTATFSYTIQAGDTDSDGVLLVSPVVLNGGTIKDLSGNSAVLSFTPPNTTGLLVDTTAPTITSVTPPANGIYNAAAHLDFVVTFSENVSVTGSPLLGLTIGSTARNAAYFSGTGSTALTFRYTVQPGDNDSDGIATSSPIALNGGSIQDAATNAATLAFTPPNTTGIVIDTLAPTVTAVSVPANAAYRAGQVLSFTVMFSENVTITGADSTLGLTIGSTARAAAFVSKTANSATYSYTIQAGETDTDGVTVGAITLNTTTIQDAATNSANVSLTGVVPSTAGVIVDTTAPDTSITSTPPNPSVSANATFSFAGDDGAGSGIASFECSLDGAPFSASSNPTTFTGLSDGSHTLQVRAIDNAGNIDPTPASYTWIVNGMPTFLSGPTATPNPAVVGVEVIFTAATLPADAEIKWDFGDGSPTAIGGTVRHTYTVVGSFTVQTTARNISSSTTATTTFQIQVTDAQGVTALPGTILPLLVHGYWSFGKTNQVIVRTFLPSTTFTSAANATVKLSVNGVVRTFTFDGKGRYMPTVDRATLRLFVRTGGYFEFYANIKGNLAAALATGVNLDTNGHPKLAVVQISAGGTNYSAILPVKAVGPSKGTFGFKTKPK